MFVGLLGVNEMIQKQYFLHNIVFLLCFCHPAQLVKHSTLLESILGHSLHLETHVLHVNSTVTLSGLNSIVSHDIVWL